MELAPGERHDMTPIQLLAVDLATRKPYMGIHVEEPGTPGGPWLLEVTFTRRSVLVEWTPGDTFFGVSTTPGDGPDVLIQLDDAAEYVAGLLKMEYV